jgi:hypothetical protein
MAASDTVDLAGSPMFAGDGPPRSRARVENAGAIGFGVAGIGCIDLLHHRSADGVPGWYETSSGAAGQTEATSAGHRRPRVLPRTLNASIEAFAASDFCAEAFGEVFRDNYAESRRRRTGCVRDLAGLAYHRLRMAALFRQLTKWPSGFRRRLFRYGRGAMTCDARCGAPPRRPHGQRFGSFSSMPTNSQTLALLSCATQPFRV